VRRDIERPDRTQRGTNVLDNRFTGWATRGLISRGALQRDYDGTPMISDILPEDFYLTMARELGKSGGSPGPI